MDTPLLLNDEFQSINRSYVENIPVLLETKISKQIIAYCRLTGKCIDIIGDIDTEGNSNTDALVPKSLKALVYLLPTMGKYRVSAGAAMLFLIEELKDGETLEMFLNRSKNPKQQPFILSCGSSFFVVCDGKAIIVKPSKVSVAFDCLFKSFFVFNLEYPKQLQILYNFFQELVYKLPGSVASTKARKLFEEISHM
ncbi:uncharacterized protein LOC100206125 isoform X1 [Hydra vulgaris]|uniref:uncharacterized protein LOC100206125 isoform X1 n=1 Tax=Hydra vulgaris TaxID=6087 RepID=UPI001F5EC86A|nr:uncharacterized protein LOC100206125 isoform X2 [Hydra vulgaris]